MNKRRKRISGGQAAVQSLKKERVKHVFGLIGSATMEMFDALYHEKSIKFIGVRDERTGTHMADGYARASNKPGVIIYDMRSAAVVCSITDMNPSTNYVESFNIYSGMQIAVKATGNGYNYKVVSEFGETIVNKII